MSGIRPQFAPRARLHQQQGHRQVAGPLERLTPVLLPFRTEAHVSGDGVEEDLLAGLLPRLAEEAPALPVLRRLDDPTLVPVLVHRADGLPPFFARQPCHVMVCSEPQVATPYRGKPARIDPRYDGGRRIVPMAHRFEITKDLEVGATPEEVWEAIATGPGMDSWFMG